MPNFQAAGSNYRSALTPQRTDNLSSLGAGAAKRSQSWRIYPYQEDIAYGVGYFSDSLQYGSYMSQELDAVLKVLKTMFTELAHDLSDIRGEALAAKILAGHALDAVIIAAPSPEQTLNDLKKRTLQAASSVRIEGPSDYVSNTIVIERATERIREWFEVIAKARGLTSDKTF